MKRTFPFICRQARDLGLTDICHKKTLSEKLVRSIRQKKYIKDHGHPRGMLNKKHSDKTKAILSIKSIFGQANMSEERKSNKIFKMLKTKEAKGNLYTERPKTTWKSGWREIGDFKKYYRSRWEANYARYLEFLVEWGNIDKWEHEPKTFWFENIKRGVRSYLPDFRVTNNDGTVEYHEVKGWYDDRTKTKIKRMAKYYPEVKLVLIDAVWFKKNTAKLKGLIKTWEE